MEERIKKAIRRIDEILKRHEDYKPFVKEEWEKTFNRIIIKEFTEIKDILKSR